MATILKELTDMKINPKINFFILLFMIILAGCSDADNLISNVKYKVEEFTGMTVDKINIYVEGVRVID